MKKDNQFHLSTTAAEGYEKQKVPSMFLPLAQATLDTLTLPDSCSVLDVACGTGVISKLLASRLTGHCRIVGADLNPAMIEVARKTMLKSSHTVKWVESDITQLPFENEDFDLIFCQQGLQFFPDKLAALSEILRVLKPDGKLVLTCWRTISPLSQAASDSLRSHVSEQAAQQALKPFSFRDAGVIASLVEDAGFLAPEQSTLVVHRILTHSQSSIRKEILATPYAGTLQESGEKTISDVVLDVESALEQYREGESLVVPVEVTLFQALKPHID